MNTQSDNFSKVIENILMYQREIGELENAMS